MIGEKEKDQRMYQSGVGISCFFSRATQCDVIWCNDAGRVLLLYERHGLIGSNNQNN